MKKKKRGTTLKPQKRPCSKCGSRKRCLDLSIPISEKKHNRVNCLRYHRWLSSIQAGKYLHGQFWVPKYKIGSTSAPSERFLWSNHYRDKSGNSALAKWNMIKLSVTPKQRQVLFQQIVKKKSIDEISATLNLSWQTVYDRLKQSKARIKRYGKNWADAAERRRKDKARDARRKKIIVKKYPEPRRDPVKVAGRLWRMCQDWNSCGKCNSTHDRCPIDDSKIHWQIRQFYRSAAGDIREKFKEFQIPLK